MNIDEDIYEDSGNETSGDDVDFGIDAESSSARDVQNIEEDYPYEVLTTDDIVQHMIDCIKDVNAVVQIPATTTRILLNYFNWDKEKLMERFFDGNQEDLFREAHVVNPYKKPNTAAKPKVSRKLLGSEECEICFMVLPTTQMTGGHSFHIKLHKLQIAK